MTVFNKTTGSVQWPAISVRADKSLDALLNNPEKALKWLMTADNAQPVPSERYELDQVRIWRSYSQVIIAADTFTLHRRQKNLVLIMCWWTLFVWRSLLTLSIIMQQPILREREHACEREPPLFQSTGLKPCVQIAPRIAIVQWMNPSICFEKNLRSLCGAKSAETQRCNRSNVPKCLQCTSRSSHNGAVCSKCRNPSHLGRNGTK